MNNVLILSLLLVLTTSSGVISGSAVQPSIPQQWGYQYSYTIPSNGQHAPINKAGANQGILEFPPLISAPPLGQNHEASIKQREGHTKEQNVLLKRQESLEDKLNTLNARIENQESITQNNVRKFENREKLLLNSADRLEQLDRINREQEELKKKQETFAKSQEELKKLLTVIHSKIEEEQDRIRKFATQVQVQESQLEDSTIKRLAQLDRIDRDQGALKKQQESILKSQDVIKDKLSRLDKYMADRENHTHDLILNLEMKLKSQEALLTKSANRLTQLEAEDAERKRNAAKLEVKGALPTALLGSLREPPSNGETVTLVESQVVATRPTSMPSRTCFAALKINPSLPSGMYWIDPDGERMGDPPIQVYCNMTTGNTFVSHDSALTVASSTNCFEPGCFSKNITYQASRQQLDALIKQSGKCQQSVRYDCYSAPLMYQGSKYAWWTDANGKPQYFWAGNDSKVHTCQCGIDGSCLDSDYSCNCDAANYLNVTYDDGIISARDLLPVTQLHFGQAVAPNGFGHFALGPLECHGNVVVKGIPTSCVDVWRIGHTLSGVYIVRGYNKVVTVFCDFSKSLFDNELQTFIGYIDTKSISVYFDVERQSNYTVLNKPIPFQVETMGYGKAMNLGTGFFTAPRAGKYYFVFNGVKDPAVEKMEVGFSQSDNNTADALNIVASVTTSGSVTAPVTLQETLELKLGDKVAVVLLEGSLADASHTFSGYLLEEDLVFKPVPRP